MTCGKMLHLLTEPLIETQCSLKRFACLLNKAFISLSLFFFSHWRPFISSRPDNQMTNNINKEDDTETALDYIQRQEKLEKDAQDILPGNFDKCTFSLGYIRQPLYACKTCTVDQNEEPAGMCYSCSIACHASHDLFELFPKRAFRCDCGLSGKFGGHACSRMVPEKLEFATNEKNQYNHNFTNLYCR